MERESLLKLDQKDHSIISLLRENSRQSVRDIAKKAKLRPSTVHQRIQRLIREGVVERFTLKLNNRAVGENFIVFMLIKTTADIDSRVFRNSRIKEVFGITGEYDLLLKLKFRDVEQFNEFVINFRNEHNIRQTLTMVATLNIKEEL